MPTDQPRRFKYTLIKLGYLVVVAIIGLIVLEGGARFLGLGKPVLYYADAWGGLRPLPNQQVSRLRGATVTVDSNGFRTPVPEAPGALRILYLGDSVTWGGTSVDDTALFTEVAADVLRTKGRPVYAMNSGVNGTALLNHAELFQGYHDKLDVLVWLFPWGDTQRTYASGGVLSPARFKPRFALVEVIDNLILRYWSRLFRDTSPLTEKFDPELPTGYDDFFDKVLAERQVRNLEAVREVVAEALRRGVPVVLGVTPYRKGEGLEPLPPEASAFLDEMAAAGANVLDVSAALAQASGGAQSTYLDNAHFSAEGHRLVGQALGAKLETVIQAPGK